MYRLQVKFNNRWRYGIVVYETAEAANARVEELSKVGIQARVCKSDDLYK